MGKGQGLQLVFNKVSFTYPRTSKEVLLDINLQLTPGWTGFVGANGGGKTTLLQLACNRLRPQTGVITAPAHHQYCPQRTDAAPEHFSAFLASQNAYRYMDALAIGYDWDQRWHTLSHGERKRAQLAVALWVEPDLLAVDEPTNHLDEHAQQLIFKALAGFRGIGLLVSHDRDLLDRLCLHTVFLDQGRIDKRVGNYSESTLEVEREALAQRRCYERTRKERRRLEREAHKAREAVARSSSRLSKRNVHRNDRDTRAKINLARLTGKDTVPARLQKRLETRVHRLAAREGDLQPKKEVSLGIRFDGHRGNRQILAIEPGNLVFGDDKEMSGALTFPALVLHRGERVGISGPNGSGKSTFLRFLLGKLPAGKGLFYLPQEVTKEQGIALLKEIKALSGPARGRLMQLVSRLGSDPKRLLVSHLPSPGETRKLMLATGLLQQPSLLVLDEPTNHLDLPSVNCLSQALSETECALVLVSHDARLLSTLADRRWRVRGTAPKFHLEE
ncbi:ABC-F family ATP-binding cassette domain-containing protein [Sulfidibacter corallicola]|uniref:ABC-F family ATP-binding cassette domain-containing protein n=1 Tax=Sulfidibacter corallicola TaxID=2818388 RepID=A0A8A4TP36_SULCO|nr:ATP-binding cassette domain-containing protein [Sulfidibacter corallicola]QTD50661.1 ABC-F family ATP-binding cassette domain-containing protein [Sulfidibacter corallicola]